MKPMQKFGFLLCILLMLAACREDEDVVQPTVSDVGKEEAVSDYRGMYVLCEGNMG